MTETKTWFITGCSGASAVSGRRGPRARRPGRRDRPRRHQPSTTWCSATADSVLPIELDVTDRVACHAAVVAAHERLGRLDVVVNNAGYGHFELRRGADRGRDPRPDGDQLLRVRWWVTQAALPLLRRAGLRPPRPGVVDRRYLRLRRHRRLPRLEVGAGGPEPVPGAEVGPLGIHVTLVEPGAVRHRLGRPVARRSEHGAGVRRGRATRSRSTARPVPQRPGGPDRLRQGDPRSGGRRRAAAAGLLRRRAAVDRPRRLRGAAATWEEWQGVAELAQG